jgi:hypothetical protein
LNPADFVDHQLEAVGHLAIQLVHFRLVEAVVAVAGLDLLAAGRPVVAHCLHHLVEFGRWGSAELEHPGREESGHRLAHLEQHSDLVALLLHCPMAVPEKQRQHLDSQRDLAERRQPME